MWQEHRQRYIRFAINRLRYVFHTLHTSELRTREFELHISLSTDLVVFCDGKCYGVFCYNRLERRSANGREGAHLSLCFRYSPRRRVKIGAEAKESLKRSS